MGNGLHFGENSASIRIEELLLLL